MKLTKDRFSAWEHRDDQCERNHIIRGRNKTTQRKIRKDKETRHGKRALKSKSMLPEWIYYDKEERKYKLGKPKDILNIQMALYRYTEESKEMGK